MQYPFSCTPGTFTELERAFSNARLSRYLPAAGGDKHLALRLYVWNARLCEEFYLPLQTAEVCVRNAIADTLVRRYGEGWYSSPAVHNLLLERHSAELNEVARSEQLERGINFTRDHVVAGLSFGFWVGWMTSRYQNHIWMMGVNRSFPNAPANLALGDAHAAVDQLRRFRNKVAHHHAIFDRQPIAEYQNVERVLNWVSPAALWLTRQLSSPSRVINKRPMPIEM